MLKPDVSTRYTQPYTAVNRRAQSYTVLHSRIPSYTAVHCRTVPRTYPNGTHIHTFFSPVNLLTYLLPPASPRPPQRPTPRKAQSPRGPYYVEENDVCVSNSTQHTAYSMNVSFPLSLSLFLSFSLLTDRSPPRPPSGRAGGLSPTYLRRGKNEWSIYIYIYIYIYI